MMGIVWEESTLMKDQKQISFKTKTRCYCRKKTYTIALSQFSQFIKEIAPSQNELYKPQQQL